MKALLMSFVISMISVCAHAQAAQVQPVHGIDIMMPCLNDKVNMNATPAMNVYTSTSGFRVGNYATNQVMIIADKLVMQASSGESTVLGTLKSQPTCDYSSDFQEYRPSWVNVAVSPELTMTVTLVGKQISLKITDPSIPHDYNMNWSL